jgi:hypothetical protein
MNSPIDETGFFMEIESQVFLDYFHSDEKLPNKHHRQEFKVKPSAISKKFTSINP